MEFIEYFSFVLNAIVLILLMLFSRESLPRIRKIIDILSNGGFRDCPYFVDQQEKGKRWYDKNKLQENHNMKGGEDL